jgi:hypothetical protein
VVLHGREDLLRITAFDLVADGAVLEHNIAQVWLEVGLHPTGCVRDEGVEVCLVDDGIDA